MAEAKLITTIDEFEAEYKKGIGAVLPYRPTKEASLDNIRRFGDCSLQSRVTVSGDDLGRMVGQRGTTAGAIDELVRTVLQRQAGSSRNGRIRVDIGGVRARRTAALIAFSKQQADEVRSSGSARSLEPMSAADRKVVHDALTDEDGVDTESEGEDSQRRVVIVPSGNGD